MNDTVTSADGGVVAYKTVGTGPDVVVIPGAVSTAADYSRFAEALAGHGFTVHTIERRGRGGSCPQGADYSIATECTDVAALLECTGARLLVGHSYGGLIALEVAASTDLAGVAVYEPGVSIDGAIPSDWLDEAQRRLDDDDPAGAFVTFVKAMNPEAQAAPDAVLLQMLPQAMGVEGWQHKVELMGTTVNEHREVSRLNDTYAKYENISADVLLMYGGSGAGTGRETRDRLAGVIRRAATHEFAELDHFGIDEKDPETVAAVVAGAFAALTASANA
ncbi:alpha/beta hydrolase [Rathayibacter sp. CAU 1779]